MFIQDKLYKTLSLAYKLSLLDASLTSPLQALISLALSSYLTNEAFHPFIGFKEHLGNI
jgi:hypothetical protein